MTSTHSQLTTHFPQLKWQFAKPLAPLTYFKLGGPAEMYLETADENELVSVIRYCRANQIKVTMLGGASNVVVADEGISGLVIRYVNRDVSLEPAADNSQTMVVASAGCQTALLVGKTTQWNLTGLEGFLGVPGTIGGAILNNAHYLSYLIGDHIHSVKIITNDGDVVWLPAAACDFKYDHSRFRTTHEVILAAKFELLAGTLVGSRELIKKATEYRVATQPLGEASSGCIFQNTPNTPELQKLFPQFANQDLVPGGFLIDQAGLKGEHIGDIEVSHKHAAFFVNRGKGTAAEVKALITKVQNTVKAKFGVELRAEVFYLS